MSNPGTFPLPWLLILRTGQVKCSELRYLPIFLKEFVSGRIFRRDVGIEATTGEVSVDAIRLFVNSFEPTRIRQSEAFSVLFTRRHIFRKRKCCCEDSKLTINCRDTVVLRYSLHNLNIHPSKVEETGIIRTWALLEIKSPPSQPLSEFLRNTELSLGRLEIIRAFFPLFLFWRKRMKASVYAENYHSTYCWITTVSLECTRS